MNVVLRLEFCGTPFSGWQRQATDADDHTASSIQFFVERAAQIAMHGKSRVVVHGCGRTDAGVHAKEFFCQFEAETAQDLEKLRHSINHLLPDGIVATGVWMASESFHVLKSAKNKTYLYRVLMRRAKPTLERDRVWWLPRRLYESGFDLVAVESALSLLRGTHDFGAFEAQPSERQSTIRTFTGAGLTIATNTSDGHIVEFRFTADGFLRHMVRNLVGTLIDLGEGKIALDAIRHAIDPSACESSQRGRLRETLGRCAPPEGLYLESVEYDNGWQKS